MSLKIIKFYQIANIISIGLLFHGFNLYPSQEKKILIRSESYDIKTGEYLYSENHEEYYINGVHQYSIIRYRDPNEKEFARKRIEFKKGRSQPDFILEDFRTGYFDKVLMLDYHATEFLLEHRRSKEKPIQRKVIQVDGGVVVDGGFDYFIRDNFSMVTSGDIIKGYFVLANRLDYFQCRVWKSKDLIYNGREAVELYLAPENFFLRQLADKLIVIYDKKSRRLLEYRGISNLQDNAAEDFPKVRIVFRYPNGFLDKIQ